MNVNGYDEWLTIDTRREAAESCAEEMHRFNRHDGCCVYCGEEDKNFDPDRADAVMMERMESLHEE